jgi:hypothetical protein
MTARDVAIVARSDGTTQERAIPARSDTSAVAAVVMTGCSTSVEDLCIERQRLTYCQSFAAARPVRHP